MEILLTCVTVSNYIGIKIWIFTKFIHLYNRKDFVRSKFSQNECKMYILLSVKTDFDSYTLALLFESEQKYE